MSEVIDHIKLNKIERGSGVDGKPAMICEFSFTPERHTSPMLTATLHVPLEHFDEANAVQVARHYFHGTCQHLATGTVEWEMSKDNIGALHLAPKS